MSGMSEEAPSPDFDDEQVRRMFLDLANDLGKGLFLQFVKTGQLEVEGRPDQEVRSAFLDLLRDFLESEEDLTLTKEYSDALERLAKEMTDSGQHEIAVLLYATWVEHWMNDLIVFLAVRRKLSDDYLPQLLRLKMEYKSTWLLELMNAPPLHEPEKKAVDRLMQTRNQFAHYKFQPFRADGSGFEGPLEREAKAVLASAPELLARLRQFRDEVLGLPDNERANRILGAS